MNFPPNTMKAIVHFGSHQFECEEGEKLSVLRLPYQVGEEFVNSNVSFLSSSKDSNAQFGKPNIAGAQIRFKVLKHLRGPKLIIFKKRSKKAWKKKNGFRAELTELKVEEIKVV